MCRPLFSFGRHLLGLTLLLLTPHRTPADQPRWALQPDGGIVWTVRDHDAHTDNIEMSGEQVSVIVTYGVDDAAQFQVDQHVVFPLLRFAPNGTRDHLALDFGDDVAPRVIMDQRAPRAVVTTRISHHGIMQAEGFMGRDREIAWTRRLFPSTTRAAVLQTFACVNRSNREVLLAIEEQTRTVRTNPERGIDGGYTVRTYVVNGGRQVALQPGERLDYAVVIAAEKAAAPQATLTWADVTRAAQARAQRVQALLDRLQLVTPDPVLNTAFDFAKIRGAESIYRTKAGLLHSPGGGAYYAAIWANDQAEYANPFFAYLDDELARESARNAFRLFAGYMNPDYRAIPSSIISEGAHTWHGARDRGDMAMIAYGAGRFALARGDRATAEELWPLLEWCLEYCRRHLNDRGVVASDSDELEGRFPAGNANLCTSSLYYDALCSAALLGRDLGLAPARIDAYRQSAESLRTAIETYFGATVEGFATYRYYDKADLIDHRIVRHRPYADRPDVLRAWICIPLTVGIYDRSAGTIDALFSPRLWTDDGLATEAGQTTFWDRSTLYALRGALAAGATQRALDYLTSYSHRRLLGEHVPYPVEAYPEGNQRHLAAESTLYGRIFTEGLFGFRPTGLRSFSLTPRLPANWPAMELRRFSAAGTEFDLKITRRDADQLEITISATGRAPQLRCIEAGDTAEFTL